jgi:hypothetical protein
MRVRVRSGLVLLVGVLALAAVLSGCTSARSSLGTGDSSCFVDIPTAAAAVHSHGTFIGIHRYSLTALKKSAPHLDQDLTTAHSTAAEMCLAAYKGSYSSAGVEKPIGKANAGTLAVVAIDAANRHLLGTLVIEHAPLRFGHPHVG